MTDERSSILQFQLPLMLETLPRRIEFMRYLSISALALALDVLLLLALVEFAGWHYQRAAVSSFLAGTLLSYWLCRIWVFSPPSALGFATGFSRFLLVGIGGLCLNTASLLLLVEVVALDYRCSKLLAAGVSFLSNYIFRRILMLKVDRLI